jgi:hypothetical protein
MFEVGDYVTVDVVNQDVGAGLDLGDPRVGRRGVPRGRATGAEHRDRDAVPVDCVSDLDEERHGGALLRECRRPCGPFRVSTSIMIPRVLPAAVRCLTRGWADQGMTDRHDPRIPAPHTPRAWVTLPNWQAT